MMKPLFQRLCENTSELIAPHSRDIVRIQAALLLRGNSGGNFGEILVNASIALVDKLIVVVEGEPGEFKAKNEKDLKKIGLRRQVCSAICEGSPEAIAQIGKSFRERGTFIGDWFEQVIKDGTLEKLSKLPAEAVELLLARLEYNGYCGYVGNGAARQLREFVDLKSTARIRDVFARVDEYMEKGHRHTTACPTAFMYEGMYFRQHGVARVVGVKKDEAKAPAAVTGGFAIAT